MLTLLHSSHSTNVLFSTESVCIVTSDGRMIVGTLIGHDQVQNLILKEAHERIYSQDADVEEMPLGLYVVRGDNLCLVGDYDPAIISNNSQRVPAPLPSIHQQQY